MLKNYFFILFLFLFAATGNTQLDSSITPIRLSYFEASSANTNTTLKWKTICYLEYASFEILKSTDGNSFQPINSFTADRIRCEQPFDYTDNNATVSGQLLYKINVKDIDGKPYQSKIIAVFTKGNGFAINSFAPTVVNNEVAISISSAVAEKIQLQIINMQGSIVKQQTLALTKGASTFNISLAEIQKGNYQAIFQTNAGEKKVISFIKQ